MKRLAISFVVALVGFVAGLKGAEAAVAIDVGVNRAELVAVDVPMSEVIIASPEVADIIVHGSRSVSVIGKQIGTTNLRFFDDNGRLLRQYDIVVGHDLPAIRRALKKFFPDQKIGVETINNSLAVSGVVPDAQTANRVMQVVYEFVKENRRSGEEEDDYTSKDNRFPGIVNLMSLNSSQQVMLKVRIGELQRTALKELGVNLQALKGAGDATFQFGTGSGIGTVGSGALGAFADAANTPATASPFFNGSISVNRGNSGVSGLLNALETDGLFKVLAEPNLTAVSGETASFLAGGEFPITTTSDDGTDVEFRNFGVALNFTPFVLSQNRIRLIVNPELSEIDNSLASGGFPGLSTRRSTTTIELSPGESFMIAGLIRDQINSAINETPGIAEIPLISSLMRSTSYQRRETELVIAVTPYIVDPVVGSDIRLPVDEFRTPSTMEMFFYGALGSLTDDADRISQTPILEGPIGYMTD